MTTTNAIITKTYNESTVLQFRNDGYFNMTSAAKAFGKRLDNFKALPSTRDYVRELSLSLKISDKEVMEPKRGSGLNPLVGTWAHPKLAVFFARWLDTKFAVWCDTVIDDILRGKAEVVVTKPETSEIMKMPATLLEAGRLWLQELERAESLKLENETLKVEVEVLTHEVNHMTINEYQTSAGYYFSPSQRGKMARYASGYCDLKGITVERREMKGVDPKTGYHYCTPVKVYPREALEHAALLVLN